LSNADELEHFSLHPQALAQEAYDFPDAIYRHTADARSPIGFLRNAQNACSEALD
jgi:hypothetical protein